MRGALAILAGFVLGVVTAGLLLGGILAFAPDPAPAATPAPSVAVVLPTATPSASPDQSAASASPGASASGSAPFHVGERAPALSVPQVGGGTIDLANLKGQPVWVDFMSTSCTTCKDEFPLMTGYANRYASNGLVVIAVDVGEDEGAADAFTDGLGGTFPVGLDADGSAAKRWAALTLPVHFWIDKDGIIRDAAPGGIGPDAMNKALEKIMPGVRVTS